MDLEFIEFSLQGGDPFTAQIPKPAQANTVPIAVIRRYDPGQSENLGYAMRFTDQGESYELEVRVSGAAPNSRLHGVAMVIGLGAEFPAPEVHELELTTAQPCGEINTAPLEGRVVLEAVQRYEPGDAAVFEFSRDGGGAHISYCVDQPEQLDGALGVKVIALDLPVGALALESAAVLDSGTKVSDSFAALGQVSKVVHLIGAQTLNETEAPGIGYAISCAQQAPYTCDYELLRFKDGAAVAVGGSVLAIQ